MEMPRAHLGSEIDGGKLQSAKVIEKLDARAGCEGAGGGSVLHGAET